MRRWQVFVRFFSINFPKISRDLDDGMISEREAKAARAEVGRRLLALEREEVSTSPFAKATSHRLVVVLLIGLIPISGLGLYSFIGAPGLSDQPVASRTAPSLPQTDNIDTLLAQAADHLARHPNDLQAWLRMAPVYARLNRFAEAEDAYRQILNIGVEDTAVLANVQTNLGQIIARNNNGTVTEEALELFREAQKNDPNDPSSFFFEALALSQQGQREEAITAWQTLIARYEEENPPWLQSARDSLEFVKNGPPNAPESAGNDETANDGGAPRGPTQEDIEAVEQMSPEEQRAFIEGMVGRLAERLEAAPDDFVGWMRLIQAYMVLESPEKAKAALERARTAFAGRDEENRALDQLAEQYAL
ncbi:MAG: c-type cytochrome biogenesis protein CcmI [Pseudomonadota bacterium]